MKCNRYITIDYLWGMETKERIRRFKGGETISSIAGAAGVSRAAIIQSLKGAGVYFKGKPGRPMVKDVEVKDYSVPTYDVKDSKLEPSLQSKAVISGTDQVKILKSTDEDICKVMGNVMSEVNFSIPYTDRLKLYNNIYMTPKGCEVFDLHRGGLKNYKTFADLCKVYK